MAVGHVGQCDRASFGPPSRLIFRVRCQFWQVQRDLRLAGVVIGFMTWLWISAIVGLLGAEIDAEIEHPTVRDATTGPPTSLGTRGARVTDTVGASQGW